MAKVKVRVTNKFKDSKNNLVVREVGEIFEVSKQRAKVLVEKDVAEEVVEEINDDANDNDLSNEDEEFIEE